MRRFLLQLGKYFETVISFGGDKRVIVAGNKNVCCKYLEDIEYISFPSLGIIRLNFNYCPTCGKPLRKREEA